MGSKTHYISAAFVKVKMESLAKEIGSDFWPVIRRAVTACAVFLKKRQQDSCPSFSLALPAEQTFGWWSQEGQLGDQRLCDTDPPLFPGQQSSSASQSWSNPVSVSEVKGGVRLCSCPELPWFLQSETCLSVCSFCMLLASCWTAVGQYLVSHKMELFWEP